MLAVFLLSFLLCLLQDGIVNPTVRKNMKGSQKLYCCPIEGCPRGANRPFSQFSLVKQVSVILFPFLLVTHSAPNVLLKF